RRDTSRCGTANRCASARPIRAEVCSRPWSFASLAVGDPAAGGSRLATVVAVSIAKLAPLGAAGPRASERATDTDSGPALGCGPRARGDAGGTAGEQIAIRGAAAKRHAVRDSVAGGARPSGSD